MGIALTKSNWIFFLNWIPELLGFLMNGVYGFISKIGIPNVGLAIILFTIVMYLLMTPLQVQQQRFTKLNAVMNPELQRIQAKYKGKNDQISQQKMADETNAVYAKYGVNPMGSCIQLLIQMPVLFALYQVIYRIPGYITYIGDVLRKVAEDSAFVKFFTDYITKLDNNALSAALGLNSEVTTERVMDTVYKLNTEQWAEVLKLGEGKEFEATLQSVHEYIHRATSFLGLNISDSPMNIFQSALKTGAYGLVVVAVMIPILAWVTQMMNIKLAQGVSGNNNKKSDDTMSQTMNSMNTFMPIMSAVFCFSLPVGIGIYWVIGALVRSIQQLLINRYLDNLGIDEIVRKNQEKANKKREKRGLPPQKITNTANTSTRTIASEEKRLEENQKERVAKAQAAIKDSTAYYNKNAKPGSIASKANMVKLYDEKVAANKGKKK